MSESGKLGWKKNPHRGMTGKKHTVEAKRLMSKASIIHDYAQ